MQKTFILKPLQKIFHTFSNPSTNSFSWVGRGFQLLPIITKLSILDVAVVWMIFVRMKTYILARSFGIFRGWCCLHNCSKNTLFKRYCHGQKHSNFCYLHFRHSKLLKWQNKWARDWNDGSTYDMKTFNFYNQFQQLLIEELPPCPKYFADLVFEK